MKNAQAALKNLLLTVSLLTVFVGLSSFAITSLTNTDPASAIATYKDNGDGGFNLSNGVRMHWSGSNETLSQDGSYSATYRFGSPDHVDVSTDIRTEAHTCDKGNGAPFCVEGNPDRGTLHLNLNSTNGWEQDVTVSTKQDNSVPCGSFQTDLYSDTGELVAWTIYSTNREMSSCLSTPTPTPVPTPTPSPTPSATPTPTPTPSVSPSATPAPTATPVPGQQQHQEQTQNNNQTVNVENNINNTGGSNTIVEKVVKVQGASTVVEKVEEKGGTPEVVSKAPVETKELPKTGLPLAAAGLAGLLPVGLRLRKFGQNDEKVSANSLWTERELSK
ncbi:hypothetical protein A2858_02620 [Candidatus Daviesbacteria bacterium RIFCSPHIGHO2_01_FULL_36_37]|uniref:Uncharacterized protein n=2 Tax=Candidatus Daviesiibacteriota TaxID=1752718 RepID=A0A1F5JZY4_9BACT|nr:MAG: hypothetical protein A2858_02620 [Candidatus Daviesbacteria bacterium RIFCSPHIGHO2_01_FULL_36_37]OGE34219.1 MAG: hypothetical protein A3E66_02645 [Candidatus Daviesbacteria bacterium RIFCSPHIGHO2_12_FULL_37_16]